MLTSVEQARLSQLKELVKGLRALNSYLADFSQKKCPPLVDKIDFLANFRCLPTLDKFFIL
jgi:hypothetical protein